MKRLAIAIAILVVLMIALALGVSVQSSSKKVAEVSGDDKPNVDPSLPASELSFYPDVAKALNDMPASGAQVKWVQVSFGKPVPADAIAVGQELSGLNNGVVQYVCRALHGNGMHPGKLIGGQCNIGYYGREVEKPKYEVASYAGGSWSRPGAQGALVGGWEKNQYLNVCRVRYIEEIRVFGLLYRTTDFGVHGGKLTGDGRCHFGYGGKEYEDSNYELFYP